MVDCQVMLEMVDCQASIEKWRIQSGFNVLHEPQEYGQIKNGTGRLKINSPWIMWYNTYDNTIWTYGMCVCLTCISTAY